MRRIRFLLYKWFRRLLRHKDSPHSIAAGAAIGIFVGMLPIYGFQMITAVAVAAVARVNKVAAALPAWITNPLTIPPFLYFQYRLGRFVVGGEEVAGAWPRLQKVGEAAGRISLLDFKNTSREVFAAARALGWEVLWPTIIGGLLSGVLLGLATYPLTLRAVLWYRRKLAERRERRRQRLAAYLAEMAEAARAKAAAEGGPVPEDLSPPGP